MKKLVLTAIVAMGMAAGAYAQGTCLLGNGTLSFVGVLDNQGAWYGNNDPLTVQIWGLNSGTVGAGINNAATPSAAFAAVQADGYTLQGTFSTTVSSGVFQYGVAVLPTMPANSAGVALALVAWEGNAASFGQASVGGVITFVNPTGSTTGTTPALTGWDAMGSPDFSTGNLVLAQIPEPSTIALGVMGLSALLFRRRK